MFSGVEKGGIGNEWVKKAFLKDTLDGLINLITVDSLSMNDRELTLLQEIENKYVDE